MHITQYKYKNATAHDLFIIFKFIDQFFHYTKITFNWSKYLIRLIIDCE